MPLIPCALPMPCAALTIGSRESPSLSTNSCAMPQGCAKTARSEPKRVTFVVGMPRVFSLSTQKSDAPFGIDGRMARDWFVPLRQYTPGLEKENVVMMVEASLFGEP